MKQYLYLLSVIFFLLGCNSPNRKRHEKTRQKVYTEFKPVYISYADSGKIKKYFDKDWNIVHYKEKATYYRIADYRNGKIVPNKKVKDYYINDVLQFEGYLNSESPDVLNGLTKWYDSKGRLESTKNFLNGKLHGKNTYYYSSGNPKQERRYFKGKLSGNYIEYYDIRKRIKLKVHITNQKYNGKFQSFYRNGNIQEIGSFQKGSKNGLFIDYFENSKKHFKRNYNRGILNGSYVEYYRTGKQKTVGYYLKGKASRTWYYFDNDGDYKKYQYISYRVGAICNDGTRSHATGRGACSWHGGVNYWLTKERKEFMSGTGKYKVSKSNR